MPIYSVQKYLRDNLFPSWDAVYVALNTPGFRSIVDYVATLRAAASTPSSAFWWVSHSLPA